MKHSLVAALSALLFMSQAAVAQLRLEAALWSDPRIAGYGRVDPVGTLQRRIEIRIGDIVGLHVALVNKSATEVEEVFWDFEPNFESRLQVVIVDPAGIEFTIGPMGLIRRGTPRAQSLDPGESLNIDRLLYRGKEIIENYRGTNQLAFHQEGAYQVFARYVPQGRAAVVRQRREKSLPVDRYLESNRVTVSVVGEIPNALLMEKKGIVTDVPSAQFKSMRFNGLSDAEIKAFVEEANSPWLREWYVCTTLHDAELREFVTRFETGEGNAGKPIPNWHDYRARAIQIIEEQR